MYDTFGNGYARNLRGKFWHKLQLHIEELCKIVSKLSQTGLLLDRKIN